jgi:hypothetical protein
LGDVNKRDTLRDINVYGTIILKWSLKKYGVKMWTEFKWLRKGSSGGL